MQVPTPCNTWCIPAGIIILIPTGIIILIPTVMPTVLPMGSPACAPMVLTLYFHVR